MKKFIILMGNYGSGKTEIAMEFAMSAPNPAKTLVIDLDMVNTYFRLSDRKKEFAEAGIRLVTPNFASSHVEMLTVPAEIAAAFAGDWELVIIDLGGDAGAAALGQYKPKLLQAQCQPSHGRHPRKAHPPAAGYGAQGPLEGHRLH